MAAVKRVLIVGAGIGGVTLAIALRERGINADVVEIEARVVGVGITLTGTTLRALDMLGWRQAASSAGLASIISKSATTPATFKRPIRCRHRGPDFRPRSACNGRCSPISWRRPRLKRGLRSARD